MNCPKCNAPLNEGDKFCQVCGSVIEGGATPNPEVAPAPVVNQAAPMPQAAPVANQMPPQPGPMGPPPMGQPPMPPQPEAKKNNVVLYVLIVVIVILMAAVIFLLMNNDSESSNTESKTETEETNTSTGNTQTEVTTKNYNEVTIDGYTLQLLSGYSVTDDDGNPIIYNSSDTLAVYIMQAEGHSLSDIDKESTKVKLQQELTDVSYTTTTLNNKSVLVFTGTMNSYKVEYIYVEYSSSVIVGGVAMYTASDYASLKDDVYDMVSRVEIADTTYSAGFNLNVPDFTEILDAE